MKKMMFNDKYGLTQAVLGGKKTITRRSVQMHDYKYGFQVWYDTVTKQCCVCDGSFIVERSRYSVGEVVAIAQSYKDIGERGFVQEKPTQGDEYIRFGDGGGTEHVWAENHAGWTNKMFVKAELMPHHIKITNIRVERLQDISDEDCLREGIFKFNTNYEFYERSQKTYTYILKSPREAFAVLIDKVSGRGTWESNPLVWVYEFELVD